MSITLTFTASVEEIVSGVPQSVEITADAVATIFYTLDGTTPTESSSVYTEAISFPDNTNSVVLKAFAIGTELNESEVFTQTYAPDITRLNRTHIVGAEGVKVDAVADERDNTIGYDDDGIAISYTDEELYKLQDIYSEQGFRGIGSGTAISVDTPDPEDTPYPYDNDFTPYSTNETANTFNPYALVIVMDSRDETEVPKILNRPWGSLRNPAREFNGINLRGENSTYISGGFVKTMYSQKNNVMVSTYWDHNTNRWVKSINELPTIPRTGGWGNLSQPLVFRWISRGRFSTIPI